MRYVMSLAGGLALLAGAALAQTPTPPTTAVTTGSLATLCGETVADLDGATSIAYCRGFIVGVGQYHIEISRPGGRPAIFCLPTPSPTLEAAQASFVAWAGANPQYANERAVDGLLRWAAASYPCPVAAPARRGRR